MCCQKLGGLSVKSDSEGGRERERERAKGEHKAGRRDRAVPNRLLSIENIRYLIIESVHL